MWGCSRIAARLKFRVGCVFISKRDHLEHQRVALSELNSLISEIGCPLDPWRQGACSEWFEKGVDVGIVVSNRQEG